MAMHHIYLKYQNVNICIINVSLLIVVIYLNLKFFPKNVKYLKYFASLVENMKIMTS